MTPPSNPHLLTAEEIGRGLHAKRIGRRIIVLPEIDSTNTYALNLAMQADPQLDDGTVVFAEYQTAGRGRLGRQWLSPRGAGLHMTVLLVEPAESISHSRLMMISAIAAQSGIGAATDVETVIRWPNDLYCADRKICGILIETKPLRNNLSAVAIGIGVNCLQQSAHFPPELRDRATSLEIESSQPIDRNRIARSLIFQTDQLFGNSMSRNDEYLASRWREHSADLGMRVSLTEEGKLWTGRILDIHPTEGLLLQMDDNSRRHFNPSQTSRT